MKIHKGDNVIAVAGKDKGKKGKVVRVLPDAAKVVVEGLNVVKKHQKSTKREGKGGIIEKSMPIDVSNVMIADPKTGKPTRIGYKIEGDTKVRVAKKSGVVIK